MRPIGGALLLTLLAACATVEMDVPGRSVLLKDVPFHPDDTTLCGPSALAAVLEHSGARVSVADLEEIVYLPGLGGSLQAEMLAGIRRFDQVALALPAQPGAITDALQAGYPVLILQRLGALWQRAWHYAVVVGYDPADDVFVLRSGVERELRMRRREFLRVWRDADHWAYVVAPPGTVPPFAGRQAYLDGAVGLEAAERLGAAKTAFASGRRRWPGEPMFGFGYGNVLVREGDLAGAAGIYQCLHRQHPAHAPILNNLAWTLGELGCAEQAVHMLDAALQASELSAPARAMLAATREEILSDARPQDCPLAAAPSCATAGLHRSDLHR